MMASFRRYRFTKRTHRNQDLGPFISHEMNRCIACYRCVRYYKDYADGTDLGVYGAHDNVYFGRPEDGIYGKSLVKYLTMRLDDETNQLLIAAKNRSGWCKTDEAADRVIDHLIKFPDFYNSEIFREADKEEDITFNTL